MSRQEMLVQQAADAAIQWLRGNEPGFVSAVMIDWRTRQSIVEPKIQMTTLLGTWEAWAEDGEAIEHLRWQEAVEPYRGDQADHTEYNVEDCPVCSAMQKFVAEERERSMN